MGWDGMGGTFKMDGLMVNGWIDGLVSHSP